jgi:dipeptidyl aminopeptidase/acylaminoacyl peptidase
MRLRLALIWLAAVAATAVAAPLAHATYPGENGKLLLERWDGCFDRAIYTIDPDGSDETRISPPASIDWTPESSPDGQRIAFTSPAPGGSCLDGEIWVMNSDGTGRTRLTFNSPSTYPTWSPDGSRIAFTRPGPPGPCGERENDIWTMNADGSAQTQVTSGPENVSALQWSPDGAWITYHAARISWDPDNDCENTFLGEEWARLHVPTSTTAGIDWGLQQLDWSPDSRKYAAIASGDVYIARAPDGGQPAPVLTTPSVQESAPIWSPDGQKLAYNSNGTVVVADPDSSGATQFATLGWLRDWQPVHTPSTYARPKAATPSHLPLVPAYGPCTSPNRQHGGGLAIPSCAPPNHLSPTLTVGTGDGSLAFSRSVGHVRLRVLGTAGGVDDSDVAIAMSLTNVMRKSDLSDYTGELGVDLTFQLTDREGPVAQTSQSSGGSFTAPCTGTESTTDGGVCALNTSVEALIPNAIVEGSRAIFELGPIRVRDGGSDEDADTPAGEGTLATQGVFVP